LSLESMEEASALGPSLLCRVRTWLCALPIEHVVETMRPLPIELVSGAPSFVLGVSILRGRPVPVVDAARLLGAEALSDPTRFVAVNVRGRSIALAVDSVVGVRSAKGALDRFPPLLQEASILSALGTLDAELLFVLRAARLVPEGDWIDTASGTLLQ
jgi:purine-binding chemotaxis protein CheW